MAFREKKKRKKEDLTSYELRLCTKAYELGFNIGYGTYEDKSTWVKGKIRELMSNAERRNIVEFVMKEFERGKEDGKLQAKRLEELKGAGEKIPERKERITLDFEEVEEVPAPIKMPRHTEMPKSISPPEAVKLPKLLKGVRSVRKE